MRKRRGGRSPFVVGAVLLVLIVLLTYMGFTRSIPFVTGHGYTVKAAFRDDAGIKKNSPVRIAGVEVGKVTKVGHTAPGSQSAIVTMQIKDNGLPLHTDATATIRPRIFLEGNFFVQLSPGTPDAPIMKSGSTISADRTQNPVQFDQVLGALRADTRSDLRTALVELGKAQQAGAAKAINRSLRYQPDAYKYSAIVAHALLGEQPSDLPDFIAHGGTVAAAIDRFPQQLKDLIVDFNTTAGALAAQEANLRAAVGELPNTLHAALPALAALDASFPPVRQLAVDARPAVRSTGPTARALIPLITQARGLVSKNELRGLANDLQAATPPLASFSKQSVPFLEQLRLISSCTTNVLVPFGNSTVPDQRFKPTGPVYQELAKFLPGLAGESRSSDANGQWFKVLGTGGPETVSLGDGLFGTSLFPLLGVNPAPQRTRPPLEPAVPCETQQPPNLGSNPQGPPQTVDTGNGSPLVTAREALARNTAIALMRSALRQAGISVPVLDQNATLSDLTALARKTGLTRQLDRVRAGEGPAG
jgi:virulence factor Mce-like protein